MQILLIEDDAMMGSTLTQGLSDLGLPPTELFHCKEIASLPALLDALTTVRYPIITMATQAAELALALAEHRPPPEITHLFSPTLVRRHSVIAPLDSDKS